MLIIAIKKLFSNILQREKITQETLYTENKIYIMHDNLNLNTQTYIFTHKLTHRKKGGWGLEGWKKIHPNVKCSYQGRWDHKYHFRIWSKVPYDTSQSENTSVSVTYFKKWANLINV